MVNIRLTRIIQKLIRIILNMFTKSLKIITFRETCTVSSKTLLSIAAVTCDNNDVICRFRSACLFYYRYQGHCSPKTIISLHIRLHMRRSETVFLVKFVCLLLILPVIVVVSIMYYSSATSIHLFLLSKAYANHEGG